MQEVRLGNSFPPDRKTLLGVSKVKWQEESIPSKPIPERGPQWPPSPYPGLRLSNPTSLLCRSRWARTANGMTV
jgi:hypothetical protein